MKVEFRKVKENAKGAKIKVKSVRGVKRAKGGEEDKTWQLSDLLTGLLGTCEEGVERDGGRLPGQVLPHLVPLHLIKIPQALSPQLQHQPGHQTCLHTGQLRN